jgi:hypothetical protein
MAEGGDINSIAASRLQYSLAFLSFYGFIIYSEFNHSLHLNGLKFADRKTFSAFYTFALIDQVSFFLFSGDSVIWTDLKATAAASTSLFYNFIFYEPLADMGRTAPLPYMGLVFRPEKS